LPGSLRGRRPGQLGVPLPREPRLLSL